MNSPRIDVIRQEVKKYHDHCYDHYKLFEQGSWLYKPVQSVMELLNYFDEQDKVTVLDLGAGVGRNSIPIAQKLKGRNGQVVCVDLLDTAIDKLKAYGDEYEVAEFIFPVKEDIGTFSIQENEYDYIVAVSSLEHVESEEVFERVLVTMEKGTKSGGINCLIVNSEVEEMDMETGSKLDALMEVNISTEQMHEKLRAMYKGWNELLVITKPLEYQIERNGKQILLKTNAITYAVQKGF
ncbi:class I SAM-dependent methyltransferase [Jeotgalibacillus soli]|uniref:Methyltransferase domain-containing protein n=1 Tax=Jeotgalibacillus soli TaxID=889306 RepID=A0A0C2W5U8_9BACL|nr:class I SAM-dependent methyltransferase [Jeotgalibacillus soli]KIL51951.1 hypothetical protein KP78_03210 [Jeotgalibacillus soli]